MTKSIISILSTFIVAYLVGLYAHQEILETQEIILPFSIEKLYLFLAGFSILICINLQLLTKAPKLSEQLGLIYLGTLMLKIILFSAVFYPSIIKQESLIISTQISLLTPIFLFLIIEVFFVAKILNRNL